MENSLANVIRVFHGVTASGFSLAASESADHLLPQTCGPWVSPVPKFLLVSLFHSLATFSSPLVVPLPALSASKASSSPLLCPLSPPRSPSSRTSVTAAHHPLPPQSHQASNHTLSFFPNQLVLNDPSNWLLLLSQQGFTEHLLCARHCARC